MLPQLPREDLFAILALEKPALLLSRAGRGPGDPSRLYFERLSDGRFRSPRDYPAQSVATVATHDLPTLVGYREGRDIAARQRVGISSVTEVEQAQQHRLDDCRRLGEALASAGFPLPAPANASQPTPAELVDAVHRFLAAASARLFLAQLDDLLGEVDQINVPGTVDTYPNGRRKLSLDVEVSAFADAIARLARICRDQGRGPQA
jgi:4-alpha-glucanotransferase